VPFGRARAARGAAVVDRARFAHRLSPLSIYVRRLASPARIFVGLTSRSMTEHAPRKLTSSILRRFRPQMQPFSALQS
jgi:hypothetical protein